MTLSGRCRDQIRRVGFLKGPIYKLSGFPEGHLMHWNRTGVDNGEILVKATVTKLRFLL
jgi:hypothetical protein